MPRTIQEEVRANTPIPQGQIQIAEGETAVVRAEGEWICNSMPTGPSGNPGEKSEDDPRYPVAGANRGCLVITLDRGQGEERLPFLQDTDTFEFSGPCTIGFSPNDDNETLDENFGLLTATVDVTP